MKELFAQITKTSKRYKVLYLDNDIASRRANLALLNHFFDHITVASDGKEGLEKLQSSRFDIIFTDIRLPGVNGVKLLREIRRIDPGAQVVIISAVADTGYFTESIRWGIEGYLLKPLNKNKFVDIVSKCVGILDERASRQKEQALLKKRVETADQRHEESFYRDSLTGLYNSLKLEAVVCEEPYDVMLILDIAHFKLLCQEYGITFSNEIMRQTAMHIDRQLLRGMRLFKAHSDKFVIISKGISLERIHEFSQQLYGYFGSIKLDIQDLELMISLHMGLTKIDRDKPEEAFVNVQFAVDMAKQMSERYGYLYDPAEHGFKQEKAKVDWLNYTIRLIEQNKIEPFYQPIVDSRTKKVSKYEVLARGVDNGKVISPQHFLNSAERLGMITTLTRMMVNKSFQFFQHNDYHFSINVTEKDFMEGYLVDFIRAKFEYYQIDPRRITIEILENVTLTDKLEIITEQISQLRTMGIKIAIDDFGVENSNLSRLMHIELDYIKLDGMYIKNIAHSKKDLQITKGIVKLAKTIGAELIAEYVVNEEIFDILKQCGVDYVQGFYFGAPSAKISVA